MYIVKNALKCISRAKGRNILIGVIVLVIALSSCLGLSIRQAAESAKNDLLDGITVTGSITRDMSSMMDGFKGHGGAGGGFNREDFDQMLGSASALTIEDYQKYAESDKVKDFYYTLTAYLNGTDDFSPVGGSESSDGDTSPVQGEMGGRPGGGKGSQMMGMNSDFTVTGYSSLTAMTDFINGSSYVSEGNGSVFDVTSADLNCMISETLATYNDISVGDTVTLVNPNLETETYTFTVVAIYTSEAGEGAMGGGFGGTSSSPVNQIYLSYPALKSVADLSSDNAESITDESGRTFSSALTASLNGTYVFANVDDYYAFGEQVYEMGLDEGYTVTSSDLNAYETSLIPLNTLSEMAGYFLIVILLIGAVILVVLNIFNVRERKYEIGVLTAMGMKKGKVALQFLCEIFAVTIVAVTVGAGIGAVSAVPVTNALLEGQISAQEERQNDVSGNFGKPDGMPELGSGETMTPPDGENKGGRFDKFFGGAANYVSEVTSATDLTVVLQMLGIAVLLTLIAGAASMLFVMRYEPLKILANRD